MIGQKNWTQKNQTKKSDKFLLENLSCSAHSNPSKLH